MSNILSRFWNRWVAFWAAKEFPVQLAVFRILCALALLFDLGRMLYSGAIDVVWIDQQYGGYRILYEYNWLVEVLGGPKSVVVWGLVASTIVGAVFMLFGFLTKLGIFITWQAYIALLSINAQILSGYNYQFTNALWILLLSSCGETLSVDCRIRTGKWRSNREIMRWPRVVLVVAHLLSNTSAGFQKVGSDWPMGGGLTALYFALQQPIWQLREIEITPFLYHLTQLGTLVAWIWESTSIIWLFAFIRFLVQPDSRWAQIIVWAYTLIGIIFHLSIFSSLEVGGYPIVCLVYYVLIVWPRLCQIRSGQFQR